MRRVTKHTHKVPASNRNRRTRKSAYGQGKPTPKAKKDLHKLFGPKPKAQDVADAIDRAAREPGALEDIDGDLGEIEAIAEAIERRVEREREAAP